MFAFQAPYPLPPLHHTQSTHSTNKQSNSLPPHLGLLFNPQSKCVLIRLPKCFREREREYYTPTIRPLCSYLDRLCVCVDVWMCVLYRTNEFPRSSCNAFPSSCWRRTEPEWPGGCGAYLQSRNASLSISNPSATRREVCKVCGQLILAHSPKCVR